VPRHSEERLKLLKWSSVHVPEHASDERHCQVLLNSPSP